MDKPEKDLARRVEKIVAPTVDAMGYGLVCVRLRGKKQITMQIMAERQDTQPMTVEDCAAISREISPLLDVEDPVVDAYSLEVSSPGIDRPLVRRKDFVNFAGYEIQAELSRPIASRRRFQGRLLGLDGDNVLIRTADETAELPFDDISQAKLVMSDELLEAHSRPHL